MAVVLHDPGQVRLSAPTILALYSRLSVSVTSTSVAPSTTWALVMMKPSADKIKPEPTPRWRSISRGAEGASGACLGVPLGALGVFGVLGMGIPNRRKNSSMRGSRPPWASSSPSSAPPPKGLRTLIFSEVRMLTTEGPTCSTSSVKSGKPRRAGLAEVITFCAVLSPLCVTANVASAVPRTSARLEAKTVNRLVNIKTPKSRLREYATLL